MSKRAPSFQMYPSDLFGSLKVRLMSADAKAFYALLLLNIWEYDTQFSIPDDPDLISKLLEITPERWFALREEIVQNAHALKKSQSGRLFSTRLRKEKDKTDNYRKSQSEKGKWKRNRGLTGVEPGFNPPTPTPTPEEEKEKRVPSKTQEPCPKPSAPDDAIRLASLLFDLISNNNPKAKPKTPADLGRWAADLDKIHRLDNQAWTDIETVLRWSQDDGFWSKNILSGATLRKQWDKLSAKVFGGTNGPGTARLSPGHPGPQESGTRSKYDDITPLIKGNLTGDDDESEAPGEAKATQHGL